MAEVVVEEGGGRGGGGVEESSPKQVQNIRANTMFTKDFDGLRGILSVWIVLFHSFVYSDLKIIYLEGSVLMSLFFLLSGFGLTLGYADTFTEVTTSIWPTSDENNKSNQAPLMEDNSGVASTAISTSTSKNAKKSFWSIYWKYMYNRCVRILPIYWICVCFSIPPTLAGFGNTDPKDRSMLIGSYVMSFIPTSTWIPAFLLGSPLDGPGWTIATLFAFYLAFPFILKWMMSSMRSDLDFLHHIRAAYWIQLGLIIVLIVVFLVLGSYETGFWISTAWPPCRMNIFTMSIAAALLCKKYTDSPNLPWFGQSGQFLPISFFSYTCCCTKCVEEKCCKVFQVNASTEVNFHETITSQLTIFLCIIAILIIATVFAPSLGSSGSWFQGLSAFCMLDFMVGLVRAKGTHPVSKVLSHPVSLWLGEISMALYLVHEPCIYYFYWIQNHMNSLSWPSSHDMTNTDDKVMNYQEKRTMPAWGIAVILPVSLVLASILYYAIELPINKRFRSK